jgi:hypothetical protein
MPASSEKQRRFFGAVMGAKKGKGGVGGKARKAAKGMSEDQIKDFLHKAEDPYVMGFLAKCAEEGVDAEGLLKEAQLAKAVWPFLRGIGQAPGELFNMLAGRQAGRTLQVGSALGRATPWSDILNVLRGKLSGIPGRNFVSSNATALDLGRRFGTYALPAVGAAGLAGGGYGLGRMSNA